MKFRSGLLILLIGLFSIISVGCTTSTDVREKDSSTIVDCDIGADVDLVVKAEIVSADQMVEVLNWIECIKVHNSPADLTSLEAKAVQTVVSNQRLYPKLQLRRFRKTKTQFRYRIFTNPENKLYRRARDGFRRS